MSMITKAAGIDPLIAAVRKKEWQLVILLVVEFVARFTDKGYKDEAVAEFKKELAAWDGKVKP